MFTFGSSSTISLTVLLILKTLFIPLISSAILFIVYWFQFLFLYQQYTISTCASSFIRYSAGKSGYSAYGSSLKSSLSFSSSDRNRIYHGPVQSGIPVRFRSVPVLFRSVYVRLSAAVPVVVDKEPSRAGKKPAAADRAALWLLVAYLFPCITGAVWAGWIYAPFVPYTGWAFPVESVVEQAA